MATLTKTTWQIDPMHSEIQFKVKHMMISTVTGSFTKFSGTVETEGDDFQNATIAFEADIDSISTNDQQRDGHLKSDDFFNAADHPKLTFRSKSFTKTGEDSYTLTGDLTIRDVTKEVLLDVSHGGIMVDPWGNTKAGFELTGKINRKDFGLKWSAVTEAGGVVVSDDVRLLMNIELAKQA